MRVRVLSVLVLLTAVAATTAATTATTAAAPAASAAAPATVVQITRPVTTAGHAAPGFNVRRERAGRLDCGGSSRASVVAVDPNIDWCWPAAEYAVACWNHRPGHVLCMRDPSSHKVYLIRRGPKFAKTDLSRPRDRAPFLLVLTDGTRCTIRDGGAWGWIPHHHRWYGSYSCDAHGVVFAKPRMSHGGVDESQSSWTVRTSNFSWPLKVRHVATAYFVGTASS